MRSNTASPVSSQETPSSSMRNNLALYRLGGGVLRGYREVQPYPLRMMMRTPAAKAVVFDFVQPGGTCWAASGPVMADKGSTRDALAFSGPWRNE